MADKTPPKPKRVKAIYIGPLAVTTDGKTFAPGDEIEVWDHEVDSNPKLQSKTAAKPKPAEPDTESEA